MSKLYIVGTPIGNLNDITFRAHETLKNVEIIACEDTRVTKKLLDKFNIYNKKLITYNSFTEAHSAQGIIKLIEQGNNVALVSDAGMPVVSDPGFEIINLARKNNIELEIVPGVSAVITTFTGSGFSNNFTFLGFIKDKTQQRKNELKTLQENHTYIFFVSPHKLLNTLIDIKDVLGTEVKVCLAKELTKIHETWYFDDVETLIEKFLNMDAIKGEYSLALFIPKIKKVKINKYTNKRTSN
ncbi:16S rRNA (cytidine(1402)-2'-O)-methyltransferase [Mycoplasma leonicaptivi]|uniref:16S rRNA (cytidine(1402)-2'-O)-methyltransferase n=1 Tax=Mycoplasma leonicaptivi TaxID=36742 RepID=UPI00048507AC|nr:16S rRNA (cytidine(1402)-2'-O)-methyltransferase [Mycoplasma leonicaptivi]